MNAYSKTIGSFILVALCLLIGCQGTPQADIVVNKTESDYQESDASFLQYACPGQHAASFDVASEYPTLISIDAAVIVPRVEALPVPKMSFAMLQQSDVEPIVQGLVKDAVLYQSVQAEDGRIVGVRPKEEIEQDIQAILEWFSNPHGDAYDAREENPESLQSYIDQQRALLEQLQEEYKTAPSKADMPLSTGMLEWNDDRSAAQLEGRFTDDKAQPCEILVWSSKSSYTNSFSFFVYSDYLQIQNTNPYVSMRDGNSDVDIDKAERWACDFLEALGISNMTLMARGVDRYVDRRIEPGMPGRYQDGFAFAFTPTYAGVNRNYVDLRFLRNSTQKGDTMTYAPAWPEETLLIGVIDEGIQIMIWESPYSEREDAILFENVAILPFKDILLQFQTQIGFAGNYRWQIPGSSLHRTLHITDIKLGYCRVINPNEAGTALLVPVWDFYGYEEIVYASPEETGWALDDNNTLILPAMGHSYLTINAIDGSVIDRCLGY